MERIEVSDSDEFVELKNYLECNNDSDEKIKEERGIVYDRETNEIIVKSFGYTEMYNDEDIASNNMEEIMGDIKQYEFYKSIEATLLRVFNHKSKWYIITHKKLDAFNSKWSCRNTFGELFVQALTKIYDKENVFEYLCSLLDINKVYCFLLKSNHENRIVCQYSYKEDRIIYLGRFDKGDKINLDKTVYEGLEKFGRTTEINIESYDDLKNKVKEINCFEYQGVLAVNKKTYKQIKIMNREYYKYYQLRNNNPNLRFRYLELRNDKEKIKELYSLYPKYAQIFDEYEDLINKIARMIYHFYVNRYIKNQFITLPKEEFLLMKKCHEWYLEDRKNNRVFSQKVMEFINKETPLNLYKMIQRFKVNQTMAFDSRRVYNNNISLNN